MSHLFKEECKLKATIRLSHSQPIAEKLLLELKTQRENSPASKPLCLNSLYLGCTLKPKEELNLGYIKNTNVINKTENSNDES